jgi:hypothetical protein
MAARTACARMIYQGARPPCMPSACISDEWPVIRTIHIPKLSSPGSACRRGRLAVWPISLQSSSDLPPSWQPAPAELVLGSTTAPTETMRQASKSGNQSRTPMGRVAWHYALDPSHAPPSLCARHQLPVDALWRHCTGRSPANLASGGRALLPDPGAANCADCMTPLLPRPWGFSLVRHTTLQKPWPR